ncbi:hypothetical protein D9M70_531310 [compost metagenome]
MQCHQCIRRFTVLTVAIDTEIVVVTFQSHDLSRYAGEYLIGVRQHLIENRGFIGLKLPGTERTVANMQTNGQVYIAAPSTRLIFSTARVKKT